MKSAANTRNSKKTGSPRRTKKGVGVPSKGGAKKGPNKSGGKKKTPAAKPATGSAGRSGPSMGKPKKPNSRRPRKESESPRVLRPPRSPKEKALLVAKWAAISGLLFSALGAVTLTVMFWIYGADSKLPQIGSLHDYQPAQVNRVVTSDGELIGEIYEKRRSMVKYEDLPQVLIDAFVSAEDKGFWKHEGIDYIGMMRAAIVNIRSGKKKQGASTITQQVVKNLLLTRERTFRRKFQEIILARRLENSLSKEEILSLYANEIFFGHGRYGVQEATRYLFGKEVKDLNVGEAAVLAGLPKGPNLYTPKKEKNYKRAKERQSYVLQEMTNNGYLTVEEAQKWIDEPIKVVADANPTLGEAPEFVELAKSELIAQTGAEGLANSGATVTTTVDLKVQRLARKALQDGLRAYDRRKGYGHPIKKIKEDKIDLELVRMAKKLKKKKGPKKKSVYRAIVLETHDSANEIIVDLGDYKAAVLLGSEADERFNPEGKVASERFERGSIVRVELGELEDRTPKHATQQVLFAKGPEGAVVIMDPKTRRLVALVGGYNIKLAGFNRATMAKRQAGSTFKPFVYAAAIDSGDFSAASIVNDAPEVYDLWKPENYKKGDFAGPVRLRHALNKSINTVAIRVAHDIGPTTVRDLANSLGIQSDLPDGLSLALGSGEVTPLELTNAFASIAAGGNYAPPWSVQKVGEEARTSPETRQALRSEVAYVVLDMMRTVMTKGTGSKAAKLGLDLAGKTGTSNEARDAWFVGMSPELVVGVWVGFDDFRRELGHKEGGSKTALPVFIDIMEELGKRSSKFAQPPGVEVLRIDSATGLLAAEGVVESAYDEVFLEGTGPTEVATSADEVGADDAILDQYGDFDVPSDATGEGTGESEPPAAQP
jgi:penicillin-binding protein 1A